MNRSLLLVICDFLLLSLLALARFDSPADAEGSGQEEVLVEEDSGVELTDPMVVLLQQSLEEEQEQQRQLSESLQSVEEQLTQAEMEAKAKGEALTAAQRDAEEKAAALAQEKAVRLRLAQEKEALGQQQQRLQEQKAQVEQDRRALQEQVVLQEKDLLRAKQEQEQLQESTKLLAGQVEMSVEQMALLQRELQAKAADLEKTQERLQQTEAQQQAIVAEKEAAENQLQLVAVQKELLEQNLQTEALRRENLEKQTDRLTEGVVALAENSAALKEEFSGSQTMSANALFQEFLDNKVEVAFDVLVAGTFGFGEKNVRIRTSAPVVRWGNRYVLPLAMAKSPWAQKATNAEPLAVSGQLQARGQVLPVRALQWSVADPRWGWLEVDKAWVQRLGLKIFDPAGDVSRFAQAILLQPEGNYYGDIGYKLNAQRTAYLKMDDRILTRLLGEFSPKEGDYLFSKNGRFLGLMLSSSTARILTVPGSAQSISLGNTRQEQSWQRQVNQATQRIPSDLR